MIELNFAVTNRVFNLEMICAAESERSKLPPALELDPHFLERSPLQVEDVMKLPDICYNYYIPSV
jgi:hypothetical protein